MKILYISHSIPKALNIENDIGGQQLAAVALLKQLQATPHIELTTLLLETTATSAMWDNVRFIFRLRQQLKRHLKQQQPDAILFSSITPMVYLFPTLNTLARRIKLYAIAHGYDCLGPKCIYRRLAKRALQAAHHVFPVSQATKTLCHQAQGIPLSKMTVVYNGVQHTDLSFEALFQAKQHNTTFSLLSVGRLVKRKGHTWFIKSIMPKLPSHFHYTIVGEGKEKKRLQQLIHTLQLDDRVTLSGKVSQSTLRHYYAKANLHVMPNVSVKNSPEGFGLVNLEAGICGTPTVASDIEGISEAVKHGVTGYLIPEQNVAQYLDAIHNIANLNATDYQALCHQAYQYIITHFSWQKTVLQLLEVMHDDRKS